MNMLQKLGSIFNFGQYDAVSASAGKRRQSRGALQLEDLVLRQNSRRIAIDTMQDLYRNFSLARWMVSTHVASVGQYAFHSRTGVERFDSELEALMSEWMRPRNCDATGRMSFLEIVQQMERRCVVDGDVFALKRRDGSLQVIEGDRIRDDVNTTVYDASVSANADEGLRQVQGVRLSQAGRELAYALHDRTGNSSYTFRRFVSSANMYHLAWRDRFDQVRGLSPLLSCSNAMQDLYECLDSNLQKSKVSAMFAMFFIRNSGSTLGATADNAGGYEVDLGRGPFTMDLDPGDDVKWMENNTPSNEFQDFTRLMTEFCLKSLQIPYVLFDESTTNYSASRMAIQKYNQNLNVRRNYIREFLRSVTEWKVQSWVESRQLVLPRGFTESTIHYEWQPVGHIVVDPQKEYKAASTAIEAGLLSRTQFVKSMGGDWTDVARDLEKESYIMKSIDLEVDKPIETDPIATEQQSNG
jgi:lambda family phage portal protein